MCFFFLVGIAPRERAVGRETRYCPNEERETTFVLYERRMWFYLFFVPLFPVSGRQITARCESCGLTDADVELRTALGGPGSKTCPDCGAQVPAEANFCQHCGHKF